MVRLDLFALARDNEIPLSKQLDDRRATLSSPDAARFDLFCQNVKERGGVSVNMKPKKLFMFLDSGRYLSAAELASVRAAGSGRTPDEQLRLDQGKHYAPRVLFEGSFEQGEHFLYGALNIGGAGAAEYGIFCAFLDDDLMRGLPGAFLPDNSLELYVKPAPVLALDESGLRRDVAAPAQRHCLAALKHENDLPTTDAVGWAEMLCCRERFVEAVFVGDIAPGQVKEFRVKRDEFVRLYDLGFNDMLGTLDPSDRVELEEFNKTMTKLETLRLAASIREV